MRSIFFCYSIFLLSNLCFAQNKVSDQKIFLITLDGLRWQELFTGADPLIIKNKNFVKHPDELYNWAWARTPQKRRSLLMPFVWNEIAKIGQIFGNRNLGSKVNLTNKMLFSFPGYNEILTGKADDKSINSNDKIPNPNETVLEQYAKNYNPKKVAAFASWDVFDYIINEERSKVYTNCGFEPSYDFPLNSNERLLNQLQKQTPSPWRTVRLDGFTHQFAKAYINKHKPNLIFISYGETDDFAHDGDYESYLKSTKNTDALIKDLWKFCQGNNHYKDKTTFIITTDHGRGTNPIESWKSHGKEVTGSDETWLIIFGKDVKAKGEVSNNQIYNNQIAPLVRKLMNLPQKFGLGYGRSLLLD